MLLPAGGSVFAEPLPWLEVRPTDAAEAALEAARTGAERQPLAQRVAAFEAVAQRFAGTPAAGLARLVVGLSLLEADRPRDAISQLAHPDTGVTTVADHALLGLGRAQTRLQQPAAAAQALLAAADRADSPLLCPALLEAADALVATDRRADARSALTRARLACPREAPRALQRLGQLHEAAGERPQAALAYDELDRQFPASPEARASATRLAALQQLLPPAPAPARAARELDKALALLDAGEARAALPLLQRLARHSPPEQADLVRTRLGQTQARLRRSAEARRSLEAVPADSRYGAEAAYHAARLLPERARLQRLEAIAERYAGSEWAERALLDLGNHHQKDQRAAAALPYYRRLLQSYPDGRNVERATWYVGQAELGAGRAEAAAQAFERGARLRATSGYASACLYWAGRARQQLGQTERARQLLGEVVQRFRYTYYGERALEVLGPAAAEASTRLALRAPEAAAGRGPDLPEPQRARVRELMLAGLDEAALVELRPLAASPRVEATRALLEKRRGRFRAAIAAMRRAYPEYASAAAATLPQPVWETLYPLVYGSTLQQRAAAQGLDPALVAALVCQESSFDADAVSRAGARGLMQVMPATGRTMARQLGLRRFSTSQLHDPETSLALGTLYLRQMLDRFEGRVERALAAYNAGPHRVEAWTAERPGLGSEEFIEAIPFTETRTYVKVVLGAREQYRRVYGLPTVALATPTTGQ